VKPCGSERHRRSMPGCRYSCSWSSKNGGRYCAGCKLRRWRKRAVKKSVMIKTDAISTPTLASVMATFTNTARYSKICNYARIGSWSSGWRLSSQASCCERSIGCPKRLVLVSSSMPMPEIRMTGPMAICWIGISLLTDSGGIFIREVQVHYRG